MTWEGLRKRLRGLFHAPAATGGPGGPAGAARTREAALCLHSPDGQERLIFYRRRDGLWEYVREAFTIEHENYVGYWYPAEFSGLYGRLTEARRDAAAGRAWAAEGEAG